MNGRRYELRRVDGRVSRWTGWAATIADARRRAAEKATPGAPIDIQYGPGARYGQLVERVEYNENGGRS